MKKFSYLIITVLASAVLVACNEDKASETNTKTPVSQPANNDVQVSEPTESEETNIEPALEKEANNETTVAPTLMYASKGKKIEALTSLAESESQNFKIYMLPDFTLTSEEAGNDILLYHGNAEVFMRIETISSSEMSYKDMLEATKEYMNASSSNGKSVSYSEALELAPSDAKNVNSFINTYDADQVVALLFEKDNLIVRLTVFDTKDVDLSNAMLQMGATITTK